MSAILHWFLSVIQALILRVRLLFCRRVRPTMEGLPNVRVRREKTKKVPHRVTEIERMLYRERVVRLVNLHPDKADVLTNLVGVDPFCGR